MNLRHNGYYGVDVTGSQENVERAMIALNSYDKMRAALETCEAAMKAARDALDSSDGGAAYRKTGDNWWTLYRENGTVQIIEEGGAA